MKKRQEQREIRKKDILSSALSLFSKKGYSATKIADIAKSVGMSAGLLFHYFESKEVLYRELIVTGIKFVEEKTAHLIKEPIGYFECATAMIIDLFKSNIQAAQLYKLIRNSLKTDALPEQLKAYIKEVFVSFLKLNEEKMIAGQLQGTIKSGDPKALTMLLFSCIDGVAESYLMNPELPLPQSEWIVDLIKKH